jgi:dsRNA-specific ribonuclease
MDKALPQDEDIVYHGESPTFNPYNPLNREITLEEVQSLLVKYGVPPKVTNLNLYKRAFVHQSYCRRPFINGEQTLVKVLPKPENCLELFQKSNERLEFLGDGVLECITKYYLYRRFPRENECFMTEKKIALVKNDTIGRFAYEMGLHKWFILSKHAEEKKMRGNLKKLGCLFEAFLGALFLDFNKVDILDEERWFSDVFVTGPGFQVAQIFIEKIFETHIDWTQLINTDDNYKNILQVKIQKEFKTTPEYVELAHTEAGYKMGVFLCVGQPIWKFNVHTAIAFDRFKTLPNVHAFLKTNVHCLIYLGEGVHKIKKKAEQLACERALKSMADDA